jgi:hypothetical protein
MMDASIWEEVIAELSPDHRCVAPTPPMGVHRHAMHAVSPSSSRKDGWSRYPTATR